MLIHRFIRRRDIFAQTCERVLRDGTGTLPALVAELPELLYIGDLRRDLDPLIHRNGIWFFTEIFLWR